MSNKIRVGIIGAGNCAKSLVQGIEYYTRNDTTVGLMYPDIGGYSVKDIEFVIAWDIDSRKVDLPLVIALSAEPNCAMNHVHDISPLDFNCISFDAKCYPAPLFDGYSDHMSQYPKSVTFDPSAQSINLDEASFYVDAVKYLRDLEVDVLINYLPVGSEQATLKWLEIAVDAGVHFVNCIPTCISSSVAQTIEENFIESGLTIIGSDMRSGFGASRLSEVLQGSMLDSGLFPTQHIQMNMSAGSTQGEEHVQTGRTANTDFLNMANADRLKGKHVSKENVLRGANVVRDVPTAGTTMYAGPSLTVQQVPGGTPIGSDQKIANLDIVAYGFGGARYELSARLAVQDSPNSGSVVCSAIRFCKVASEMEIVGFLRGPSAWTQKTPPLQLETSDAKFECDKLAIREYTQLTKQQDLNTNTVEQIIENTKDMFTFADNKLEYDK